MIEVLCLTVYLVCGLFTFDYAGRTRGFEDGFEMIMVGLLILSLWPLVVFIELGVETWIPLPDRYR